jgi:DNA polymerase I-like protein with 3'-5' exonuclease and polymerase domains
MSHPFTINKHVYLASEMMQARLKLNRSNYDLLKELCYAELETCHRKVVDLIGREINVGSSAQLQSFLYGELRLPAKKKRGKNSTTADENALRELRVRFPKHKEVINAIIAEKHIRKKIESYIDITLDEDGCIPYSANPAGTETNRWSFSKSPRSRGLNTQTLPKIMRVMCDTPDRRIFISPDLPQADARIVAWDSQCERLIELFLNDKIHFHLENCIRLFGLSKEEAYGVDEHGIAWKDRDPRYVLGKAMGHAANYRMAARRLAMELGVDAREAERLLNVYLHRLYPEIPRWHDNIAGRIKREGGLRTPAPFRRFRTFYGAWAELMLRGKMSTTSWNEACAHIPQSAVADIVNVGMERLWEEFPDAQFHLHGHDSFLASVPVGSLGEACRLALQRLAVTLMIHDRPLTMKPEMSIGFNYGLMIPWNGEDSIKYEDWQAKVSHKLKPEKLVKDLYGHY